CLDVTDGDLLRVLLPQLHGVRVGSVRLVRGAVRITALPVTPAASCPGCEVCAGRDTGANPRPRGRAVRWSPTPTAGNLLHRPRPPLQILNCRGLMMLRRGAVIRAAGGSMPGV